MMLVPRCLLLLSFLLLTSTAFAQQMPLVQLTAGMYRITAEMANTPDARQTGLMHRKDMAENRGMVFVFEFDATHCMWMRNTLIPLSVAFMDGQGVILNIEDMAPQTETNHCASKPARYALEMNKGWFAQRGLAAGDRIGGVSNLRPAR